MKVLFYLPVVACIGLLSALGVKAWPEAEEKIAAADKAQAAAACEALRGSSGNDVIGRIPTSAPDFTLKDYAGRDVSLSSLRGQVVLLNFWATWCQTCVVEMPSMERLVAQLAGQPFRLLAVSVDDSWNEVRQFFPNGSSLQVLLDAERAVPKRYGTEKFPESFLIDKQGVIRHFVVADRDWGNPDVVDCIKQLL